VFARRKIEQRVDIVHVGADRSGKSIDSRIAGCDEQFADVAIRGETCGKRMLPRAAADDENPHVWSELGRATCVHADCVPTGTISLTLTGNAPRIRVYL
jgi:hypothetical protein